MTSGGEAGRRVGRKDAINPLLTIKPFTEDAPRIERREINFLKKWGSANAGARHSISYVFRAALRPVSARLFLCRKGRGSAAPIRAATPFRSCGEAAAFTLDSARDLLQELCRRNRKEREADGEKLLGHDLAKPVAFSRAIFLGRPEAVEPFMQGGAVQAGKLRRERHERKDRPAAAAVFRAVRAVHEPLLGDERAGNKTFESKHGVPQSADAGRLLDPGAEGAPPGPPADFNFSLLLGNF
jgi:hypothetical protein